MNAHRESPDRLWVVLRDMVDRMAHQLKNPLHAVVVNLEVVRVRAIQGAAENDPEALEPFVGAVEESIRLLDRRLRLLLLVSRAAGEEPTAVAPLELAADLVGALQLGDAPAPVQIEGLDREAGGARAVRARPGHLVACLVRLLDVARARSGGPVRLALSAADGALEVRLGRSWADDATSPAGSRRAEGGAGGGARGAPVGAEWAEVEALARAAGVEAEWGAAGEASVLRLRFPGGER